MKQAYVMKTLHSKHSISPDEAMPIQFAKIMCSLSPTSWYKIISLRCTTVSINELYLRLEFLNRMNLR